MSYFTSSPMKYMSIIGTTYAIVGAGVAENFQINEGDDPLEITITRSGSDQVIGAEGEVGM